MMNLYNLKREVLTRLEAGYVNDEFSAAAPMISRPLSVHNNVLITGKFSTNDATVEGRPMYVTVLRRENSAVVHDGFGFAFTHGNESFSDSADYEKHNVFIVDNNILQDHINFGGAVLTGGTVNQFLVAGKTKIVKDVEYEFEFKIFTSWATELRIWQVGTARPSVPTISSGALVDGPLGLGGAQLQDPVTGQFLSVLSGRDIGMGVFNPSGYIWKLRDFQVDSLSSGIPIQIFEFENTTPFSEGITNKIQLTYYGSGQATSLDYTEDSLSGEILTGSALVKGLDFYIAKVDEFGAQDATTPWEYLGSNTAGHADSSDATRRFIGVTTGNASDYEFSGKIYIAVTKNFLPTALDGLIDPASPSIKTDFIEISAERIKKMSDRNAMDVWVDPRAGLQKETVTAILGPASEPFLPEFKEPVYLVEKIYTTVSPNVNLLNYNGVSGINPVPEDLGVTFSSRCKTYLEFAPINAYQEISIDYYYVDLDSVQAFVESSENRSPGTDLLVRAVPPRVFSIKAAYPLTFKGSLTTDEVKTAITDYIVGTGNSGTIRKSDIVSMLYSFGVSYINLNSLKFYISVFNYKDYWVEEVELVDEYVPADNMAVWYCRNEFLNVVKQ
jgi:hypothetical protein